MRAFSADSWASCIISRVNTALVKRLAFSNAVTCLTIQCYKLNLFVKTYEETLPIQIVKSYPLTEASLICSRTNKMPPPRRTYSEALTYSSVANKKQTLCLGVTVIRTAVDGATLLSERFVAVQSDNCLYGLQQRWAIRGARSRIS